MKRAIIDNQSDFTSSDVRRVVRWVLHQFDSDIPSVVVRVERYKQQRSIGRFYANARNRRPRVWSASTDHLKISPEARHLVVVRISDLLSFGGRRMRGGPPPFTPFGWVENLVSVTAHEAKHLSQFLFTISGRPRFSEVEAEWASYRLLKQYRKENDG